MRLIAHFAVFVALLPGLAPAQAWAQGDVGSQACPSPLMEALAAAMEYAVGDVGGYSPSMIIDYWVLRRSSEIAVRDYVEEPSCRVDNTVLPKSTSVKFRLVDEDQLRKLASQTDEWTRYVRTVQVRVSDNDATVTLSVDLARVPGDGRGNQCCCAGEMILRRVSGKWVFAEWRNEVCR